MAEEIKESYRVGKNCPFNGNRACVDWINSVVDKKDKTVEREYVTCPIYDVALEQCWFVTIGQRLEAISVGIGNGVCNTEDTEE